MYFFLLLFQCLVMTLLSLLFSILFSYVLSLSVDSQCTMMQLAVVQICAEGVMYLASCAISRKILDRKSVV